MQKNVTRTLLLRSLTFCILATSLVPLPSHALRFIKKITPDSKEEMGMTVKFKRAKEGAYSITVTRHNVVGDFAVVEGRAVTGGQTDARTAMIVDYKADLEVRKGDRLIARMPVGAEKQGNNLIYAFDIARDCLKDSRFSVMESGFGPEIYEVDLKEIDRRIEASIPRHP